MATLTIELDEERAQRLQEFCASVGMSVSKWLNNFIDNGFASAPSKPIISDADGYVIAPDSPLWDAFAEIEEMKRHPEKYKTYDDVDAMFDEILAEPDDADKV